MAVVYTHTFLLKGKDAEIIGRIEFNNDGITSFDFTKAQMTAPQLIKLQELFSTFKALIADFGDIEKLELEKE